jgi:hypothetical protein
MCYLCSGMEMLPLKNTPETKVEGLKAAFVAARYRACFLHV